MYILYVLFTQVSGPHFTVFNVTDFFKAERLTEGNEAHGKIVVYLRRDCHSFSLPYL